MNSKKLSVITLNWNTLDHLRRFVDSMRTCIALFPDDVELIVVDNGSSEPSAREYLESLGRELPFRSRFHVNAENMGFPAGMNRGFFMSHGEFVLFANNDLLWPAGFDERLIRGFENLEGAGEKPALLFCAYTEGGLPAGKRAAPRDRIVKFDRFGEYPSAVAVLTRRDILLDRIGPWTLEYELASAEDADLCFTAWHKGFDVFLDEGVLVEHVGKASNRQFKDMWGLWRRNADQFYRKWEAILGRRIR